MATVKKTLTLTTLYAGYKKPDVGQTVTLKTIADVLVATATETPANSGQYTVSYEGSSYPTYGLWYVNGNVADTYLNNTPFWLGDYDTNPYPTSSYALNALSASYARNATSSSYATSASYAANVPATASHAVTASYAILAKTASYALTATSASHALTARTASYSLVATSASHADRADVSDQLSTINGAIWNSNTKLIMHFDGPNGSNNFIDEIGHTFNPGTATINTTPSVFGTGAGRFSATTAFLDAGFLSEFQLSSGTPFTVDCWITTDTGTPAATASIVGTRHSSINVGWNLAMMNGYFSFVANSGVGSDKIVSTKFIADQAWHHVAAVSNGTTVTLYVDGVSYASATMPTVSSHWSFRVGSDQNTFGNKYFPGWIDELRVVNGEAKWTSNFTPPTMPYAGDNRVNIKAQASGISQTPSSSYIDLYVSESGYRIRVHNSISSSYASSSISSSYAQNATSASNALLLNGRADYAVLSGSNTWIGNQSMSGSISTWYKPSDWNTSTTGMTSSGDFGNRVEIVGDYTYTTRGGKMHRTLTPYHGWGTWADISSGSIIGNFVHLSNNVWYAIKNGTIAYSVDGSSWTNCSVQQWFVPSGPFAGYHDIVPNQMYTDGVSLFFSGTVNDTGTITMLKRSGDTTFAISETGLPQDLDSFDVTVAFSDGFLFIENDLLLSVRYIKDAVAKSRFYLRDFATGTWNPIGLEGDPGQGFGSPVSHEGGYYCNATVKLDGGSPYTGFFSVATNGGLTLITTASVPGPIFSDGKVLYSADGTFAKENISVADAYENFNTGLTGSIEYMTVNGNQYFAVTDYGVFRTRTTLGAIDFRNSLVVGKKNSYGNSTVDIFGNTTITGSLTVTGDIIASTINTASISVNWLGF